MIILLVSTSISKADVTFKAKCKYLARQQLENPAIFKFVQFSSGAMKVSWVNEDKPIFDVFANNGSLLWSVFSFQDGDLTDFWLDLKDETIMVNYIKLNEEEINKLKEKDEKFKKNQISAVDFAWSKNEIIVRNMDSERMDSKIWEGCSGSIFKYK